MLALILHIMLQSSPAHAEVCASCTASGGAEVGVPAPGTAECEQNQFNGGPEIVTASANTTTPDGSQQQPVAQ